ncbi:cell surface glycoprotein MUC18-like isoform X1 [Seriola dumerili]|uniref:cell surface glycoprotein MUC18-like isoform X1 n=1 Tax=Seriola dumerili TaxID=41447 RepID=UPI000BBEF05D|nr:cell surface glycoprotein MUC18-like isoform X1 [Seriola dumerili]
MDGITFGRTSLLCTLLWALIVCSEALNVKVAPKVEVLKGETAKLPCTFTVSSSASNPIVEWYFEEQGTRRRVAFRSQGGDGSDENTPLTGRVAIEEDYTLTISSTQPSDELTFYCQVNTGLAGVAEAATMLKVFFAPEKPELTRPSSQAISVGETTSSEIGTCVTMNGHPQPRIIWFKDEQPLPEVKDRKEQTYMIPSVVKEASGLYTITSTLYMQPTKADKDSVFQCTVEYSMPGDQIKQKKSDTITINLNYPSEEATFSLLNTDQVKEGDTVTMKCETDGNPQPEFDFTKDGKMISGQGGLLTLKSVKRTDTGVYKCTATDFDNLDADLSGTINLNVHYIDPVNVIPAEPQVVMLGDKVEWQCKTKASTQHTVQWKKGSEVLSQDGTLSIQDVSYDKAGEYMCIGAVPSVPGLTAEATVSLTVKGKPMIETPVPTEVGKEDDMVTLKCSAYGSPAPQFTWNPAGKESVSVEGNKLVSTVTLKATAEVMKNGVTCEVTNEFGTDSKKLPVSLTRAIDNTADRVLLSGNPVLKSADKQQGGSSGVVIAVVVCVLLLLLLVALIYFLNKKSKLPCSKKGKKEVASGEVNNDIVVEMKTDKANEEAGLLNKRPSTEQ